MSNDKLTKEGKGYILCKCLATIIELFVSTFLVAYFLKISNDNIYEISLYYVFVYFGLALFYYLCSIFLAKKNKLIFYRFSILLRCIFLLLIIVLKEDVVNYIIPVALFYGLSSGMYWSSYNIMINEAISSKGIHKFYSLYNIFSHVISIVAPIILGAIIDTGSFIKTGIYAFIICVLLFLATFLLVSRKEEREKLNIKEFFTELRHSKYKKEYSICYLGIFFNGLKMSVATIITILIVLTFKSNLSLGSLSSFMALISIVVTFIFMKKYSYKNRWTLIGAFILVVFGVFCLIFDINRITIVIFNVIFSISMIIPNNLVDQKRMSLTRITNNLKYSLEHNVISESILNFGRIISYIILLIASFSNSLNIYKFLLIISIFFIGGYCLSMFVLEKRYQNIIFQKETLKKLKEVEEDSKEYFYYHSENSIKRNNM